MIKKLALLFSSLIALSLIANEFDPNRSGLIRNDEKEAVWVDSVMKTLTLDERIAQLIMIRSFSGKDSRYYDSIAQVVKQYNIGGICFFKGTPTTQAIATNLYQKAAKTPLFIALDAEWGLGMRLDSCISFPRQLTLGAIKNDELIYEMGVEIGRQLKRIGVHMNFAPVADVNNNPLNPVVNSRSFGESTSNVANKSFLYMQGMQDMGVLAVAKHFPGHGDTDSDSHYTLPVIKRPYREMDSIHLAPFKHLINKGVAGVMIAHLAIPSMDPKPKAISSLSGRMVNEILVKELGFDGLVITDGLEMKAIADYVHCDSVEIKALLAGNDILLLPVSVPGAIANIKRVIARNIIPVRLIDEKCRKVLTYKYHAGLWEHKIIKTQKLVDELNTPEAALLQRRLIEASITTVKNDGNILPLRRPDTLKIATLVSGMALPDIFQQRIGQYARVDHFFIPTTFSTTESEKMLGILQEYDLVIAAARKTNQNPSSNYGIGKQFPLFVRALSIKTNVVLVLFANPYSLEAFKPTTRISSIVMAFQDDATTADLTAQLLFGSVEANGAMPVSITGVCDAGDGFALKSLNRLKYTMPEELDIRQEWLRKADSIALDGIEKGAYPGCRILAAIDGRVIYDKAFGHHTYEGINPVKSDDIYDVASLTKVAATTLAVMRLHQDGKLDIDKRVSHYLPELEKTNKANIIIRDILTHQARLQAWIPFYLRTLIDKNPAPELYKSQKENSYGIEVAENLFLRNNYPRVMFDSIVASPSRPRHGYLYSDLGFYWLKQIVEKLSYKPFDEYLASSFYKPLGLGNTFFNAYKHVPLSRVAPTENDIVFRKQMIHGYVHDPGAAMLGGIGGHAGLFSSAYDMATIMQMLLNQGKYGEIQFIDPEIISEFTRTQFPLNNNRRGLGVDKPTLTPQDNGPTCKSASLSSYGHTGFTGTYCWVDPDKQLVYVFLSNRVHPNATPNTLSQLNIRQKIHEVFYEALRLRDRTLQPYKSAR
ncbi:MAG: glycoside hydrolase family 3 N-terminal domain-containing protein [Bacteroidales bacterium]|nr:glycoside hydrolase family 3 N-terminal domain-containing protein [Bacteroidales bacterium]MDZ4203179.1 glycoside hydrolase family 3 N-terminal domain-containing protein [Bacteroidales bacterium]